MVRVLIIPWFLYTPSLGMAKYGVLNGFQSFGFLLGTIVLSFISIKSKDKYKVYIFSIIAFSTLIGLSAFINNFIVILICFTTSFGFMFVFNTIANSTIMEATPSDKRGKVFATIGTLSMAISPIGNFIGGILGEFMNPRTIIIGSTIIGVIIIYSVVVNEDVKKFLNYETQKIDIES